MRIPGKTVTTKLPNCLSYPARLLFPPISSLAPPTPQERRTGEGLGREEEYLGVDVKGNRKSRVAMSGKVEIVLEC